MDSIKQTYFQKNPLKSLKLEKASLHSTKLIAISGRKYEDAKVNYVSNFLKKFMQVPKLSEKSDPKKIIWDPQRWLTNVLIIYDFSLIRRFFYYTVAKTYSSLSEGMVPATGFWFLFSSS
jgi:hypothetical protein